MSKQKPKHIPNTPKGGFQPPQDGILEEVVLGSILIDRYALDKIAGDFVPNLFFNNHHVLIAEAIITLYRNNTNIDLVTVVQQLKKDGKINLFTLLNSGNPTLSDGHLIEFTLENKVQEELLLHERVDLLNFLRTDLNNFQLELKTIVAEQAEGKRLYTSTEKYEYMVEKNPAVEEFRKTFNLDLEL